MRTLLVSLLTLTISSCNQKGSDGGFRTILIYPDNDLKVGEGARTVSPIGYECVYKSSGKKSEKGTCIAPILSDEPRIDQRSPAGDYRIDVIGSVDGYVSIPVAEGQDASLITDQERMTLIVQRLVCRADTIRRGVSCLQRNSHLMHGHGSTCAIQADNTVKCWGRYNDEGQLGKGFYGADIDLNNMSPSLTIESDLKLKSISSSENAFCGIDHDDEIVCWGDILPITGQPMTNSPTKIFSGVKAKTVSISGTAICIVDNADSILCAGRNDFGQLGDGSTSPNYNLSPIVGNLKGKRVELGDRFACAHLLNDSLSCWGDGADGKLGSGDEISSLVPVIQANPKIMQLSVGRGHSCVIDFDGKISCFGENTMGQLAQGNDLKMISWSDVPIFGEYAINARKIIAGYWSTCIESSQRRFFCIGGEKVNYGVTDVGTSFTRREVFFGHDLQSVYPTKNHIVGRLFNGLTIVRGRDNGNGISGVSTIDNVIPFRPFKSK